jgi:hypothetical protein
VLSEPRGADYAIWILAFALYVVDAAKLLSPQELLLVEAGRRRFAAAFSASPFTLAGRVLTFCPLLLPHRGAFVAPWGRPWLERARLAAAVEPVERLRAALRPLRAPATVGFVLLFVIGPALTAWLGTDAAVVCTAIALYPTVVVAVAMLWWRRRALRLTAPRAAWLSGEILACPAFLPNLTRKLTLASPVEADGAQILVATASPDVRQRFVARLQSRTEELIEATSPAGPEREQLSAYLATVKAAQTAAS